MAFDQNYAEDISFGHKPVLLDECLENLAIQPDGIYVDGTLGRAGHSCEIVKQLHHGKLICIDRDETAIIAAKERLASYLDKVTFIQGNFQDLSSLLFNAGISKVDGFLFDLGVSSPQLDEAQRGFSYMQDAPLDMRMDQSASLSAYDIVNTYSEEELKKILYDYGEERYAPSIARKIIAARSLSPIERTFQLVDIIKSGMPAQALREKQHPAKRSFQAIRIAVNGELDALTPMMESACEFLNVGGRLCIITFHSLEDRIVKKEMQSLATGCTCPPSFPVCVCGKTPKMKLITHKPITASTEELAYNSRSRSAKLRVSEKL